MPDNSTPSSGLEQAVNTVMGVSADEKSRSSQASSDRIDWLAIGQYITGTLAQMAFLLAALWALEWLVAPALPESARVYVAIAFFILLSIRSRVFSPLNNTRSRTTYSNVVRPGWAPPPIAFPFVWLGIGVLRVVASYLVWQAVGQDYLALPLCAFAIHLALGDTWNTIFTVEGRLGAAVPAVLVGPLASAIAVTALYWQVVPLAGGLLVPMCLWLVVASALVIAIWQLNGRERLYPCQ